MFALGGVVFREDEEDEDDEEDEEEVVSFGLNWQLTLFSQQQQQSS